MDTMIGQRIKERRRELHITQTQIQEKCGISSGNLSGIETGRYLPSAVTLLELARALNCSVDWILTGESLISKDLSFVNIKENDKKLLEYFHDMSVADQEDLLLIAEMKANKGKRQTNANSSLSGNDNLASETA